MESERMRYSYHLHFFSLAYAICLIILRTHGNSHTDHASSRSTIAHCWLKMKSKESTWSEGFPAYSLFPLAVVGISLHICTFPAVPVAKWPKHKPTRDQYRHECPQPRILLHNRQGSCRSNPSADVEDQRRYDVTDPV